ncbi:NAD-dependent protein deacylase [Podospora fimiseda]|uniref:NAD-dependent protein deacylase n=1 Tax=Podospora fimiseda TaxID=252190 RepID=A0AAN7H644_9PEZI|nr:NAD-dependent protein deacylase [Podospora fimiseda]
MAPPKTYSSISAFHSKLLGAKRILAVCGAGLSASSGLPTFRGKGGMWRNHEAMSLATLDAFERDPGLVWMFYGYRRHMALTVKPNAAHYALAELARKVPGFMCLTQNVDNLHIRASHPPSQLKLLHGSLFSIKCTRCSFLQPSNADDPFCPALAPASLPPPPNQPHPILDPNTPLPSVPAQDLPHCPKCQIGLQRPGVVWFGEQLDHQMLEDIDKWIEAEKVDLVLVIGTSGVVWPAAGFSEQARTKGETSVVVVNMELEEGGRNNRPEKEDFGFEGDAAVLLPRLLEPIIGRMVVEEEGEVRWVGGRS